MFFDGLCCSNVCFSPLVYNEKIALECGLIPFIYKSDMFLDLAGYGMDLIPKLEAYQVLAHNSIDKNSRFFSSANMAEEYFAYVIGKKVARKIISIISDNTWFKWL